MHKEVNPPVKRTPWGKPDSAYEYAPGIVFLGTPGHGGFHLSRARLAKMPAHLRTIGEGAFFEEDLAWIAVAIMFPSAFESKDLDVAWERLMNYYPEAYEIEKGVKLSPADSLVLREREFKLTTADKFVTVAAWGSWEETTPPGYVTVCARKASTGEEKHFTVLDSEYATRDGLGFVIDESRHFERDEPTGRSRPEPSENIG